MTVLHGAIPKGEVFSIFTSSGGETPLVADISGRYSSFASVVILVPWLDKAIAMGYALWLYSDIPWLLLGGLNNTD